MKTDFFWEWSKIKNNKINSDRHFWLELDWNKRNTYKTHKANMKEILLCIESSWPHLALHIDLLHRIENITNQYKYKFIQKTFQKKIY